MTEYSGSRRFRCLMATGCCSPAAARSERRLRFAPRYLTAEPRLRWLNRFSASAVGRVNLERYLVEYDLYAMRSRALEQS